MLPDEFSKAWGQGLLPLPAESLQDMPLSEPSKRFFIEAGLPEEAKPNLIFYPPPDALAPMPEMLPELSLPVSFRRYRVLADDGGTFLCIDTDRAGAVLSVDAYQKLTTRFVNASVAQFAEFLLTYRALPGPEQAKAATKQDIRGWLDQLKEKFNAIDVAALRDPDNWWSVVIEELEIFTS